MVQSRSAKSRKKAHNMPNSPQLCWLSATPWYSHLPTSLLTTGNKAIRAYLSSTATSRKSIWSRKRSSRRIQCKKRTVAKHWVLTILSKLLGIRTSRRSIIRLKAKISPVLQSRPNIITCLRCPSSKLRAMWGQKQSWPTNKSPDAIRHSDNPRIAG